MSRVRTLDSLRLLQHDEAGLQSLSSLKHDDFLAAWERGYTKEGWWNDELAAAAWKDLRRERLAKKAKKRAKKAAGGDAANGHANGAQEVADGVAACELNGD